MINEILENLEWLCTTPSPTGYTRTILQKIQEKFPEVHWIKKKKGTLIAKVEGKGRPRALACHIDTLGLVVQEIKETGRLGLSNLGGYPMAYVDQENALVHTLDGNRYEGTIRLIDPAVHASKDAESKDRSLETMELVLDERVHSKEDVEKLGILNGDFISLDPRFRRAGDGYIKSRHLDDKASGAILLTLLNHEKDFDHPPFYLVFSCYEELGHGACGLGLDEIEDFIAVDMGVVGKKLAAKEDQVSICRKDSSGPYDYDLTKELIVLAREGNLPFRTDVYPYYGSDASAARSSGLDARFALIGPGVAASHGYERTHEEGLKATYSLVKAYLESKAGLDEV